MYKIQFVPKVDKYLEKLPEDESKRIIEKILSIRHSPFSYLKKLQATAFWRLRIGKHRAIVDVVVKGKTIIVLKIGKRKNIY